MFKKSQRDPKLKLSQTFCASLYVEKKEMEIHISIFNIFLPLAYNSGAYNAALFNNQLSFGA